jgi:ketosteroid isomerase-like protein
MSLWAENAALVLKINGQTYSGADEIRSFFQGSGSFIHHRFSLVPSYKTVIRVHGNTAFLDFECHDVGEFATGGFDDPTVKTIAGSTYLAGTLRKVGGSWLFWQMTGGSSSPLSYDTYYFPIP